MSETLGPSPGANRDPQHRVIVRPSNKMWRVMLNGQVLAESEKALLVEENGYEPVTYFPPHAVSIESMLVSDSKTTCPFKGQAGYFAATVAGDQKDIAWLYPVVYDEVKAIAGYIAFYAHCVEIESEIIDEK